MVTADCKRLCKAGSTLDKMAYFVLDFAPKSAAPLTGRYGLSLP